MKLVTEVAGVILDEYGTPRTVRYYIEKWHEHGDDYYSWENFIIAEKTDGSIDLVSTLHSMPGDILLKVAIDLGVSTPDFIPSIPTFKNELKLEYKNAYSTFIKAYKQVDSDPSTAIGLANSALESIVKEILKDARIGSQIKGNETFYQLSSVILKEFNSSSSEHPKEIKTIGNSLLAVNQAIEKLRSEKTNFHGKANDDFLIEDTIYAHFIVNSVTTVGLFLNRFYRTKYPKPKEEDDEGLPF